MSWGGKLPKRSPLVRALPRRRRQSTVVLSRIALADIREALKWSEQTFGRRAAARYRALLKQAIRDIATDPERPGSKERPELSRGARTYHLRFSRERARASGSVRTPRHFLLYRRRDDGAIEVARVLHDVRDLERHLPDDYRGARELLDVDKC
jgi:toxin ParE1/3/4